VHGQRTDHDAITTGAQLRNDLGDPIPMRGRVRKDATMPRRSRLTALCTVLLAAVLLTACDQFLPEPMAYTRVGDAIVVRACIPMTISATTIEEETTTEVAGPDGATALEVTTAEVWSDTRDREVAAGYEFRLGDDSRPRSVIDDWSTTTEDSVPYALTGESYIVTMHVAAADGNGSWSATAFLEPGEIAEGEWVDSYGDPMEPPCVHDDCMPGAACWNDWPVPSGGPTHPDSTWSPAPPPEPID